MRASQEDLLGSKEELQGTNQELQAVHAEQQGKRDDPGLAYSDMGDLATDSTTCA